MELRTYTNDMADELAVAYNTAICRVPHCYPTTPEALSDTLTNETTGLSARTAFLALDGSSVQGFVDVGIVPGKSPDEPPAGVMPFLSYRRGDRAVGQQLLAAAERYIQEHGARSMEVFPQEHRYPFYHLKAAYLSDHLDHVAALLAVNGYRRHRGEIFLDWPNMDLPADQAFPAGMEVTVEHSQGRGALPGVKIQARQGGGDVGECVCVSCSEYTTDEAAQDWIFTTWLGVHEQHQGKKIGARLLERALREAQALGYRNAVISTAWDNHRACLFYSNCGYRMVDWTYGLIRTFGGKVDLPI